VQVVVEPDAGNFCNRPGRESHGSRRRGKSNYEVGWLTPEMDTQTADLIITVRKGHGKLVEPTIGGGPVNDAPGRPPTDR